ncbi:MAG: DNA-directed RNA polymerase subunit A' [Nanoarchaeota archaeon]|nr:DNA-directed RNA polymerase subunit A' [Nanoarchaeota archaeon]|tara:strand:- start:466 stop:3081 length:2616 start_codon:yes stop_codon:yes gene_type:complete
MAEEYVSKVVDKIEFGFLSPMDIRKMATVKIVTPELYDKEGYPVDGGLMDIRLGVIDPGLRCKTCGGKLKECLGHFGYIELARPVIHLKGINILLAFLRSTCRECNKLLLDDEAREKFVKKVDTLEQEKGMNAKRKEINLLVNKLKNVRKCPHCKAKQFKINLEKPTTIIENDKRIFPIEIKDRLERVNDEDVSLLGLNPEKCKPEWMVLSLLAIPPVTIRPSITLETGERSEDDLTHKLGDIVRINQRLFENINAGAPEIIVEDLWDLLQYHVTTFFDNNTAAVPPARHRSGEPLKTITERIKSKEGRFRHNLTGKRVNYSARTLVSPDPMISLNEVGVPLEVAMELSVPERVTEWNIERLKEFVKRGPEIYPGANYVLRPDGKKKKITEETKEQLLEELQPGFMIERHLMDGDLSVFNRQPSLHRMSIMSHKVKILPGRSFRLNPSVCTPYNADFDGDEMNLHIPQTEEAIAEAEILMEVQTQIITPKNGLNIIASIQDAITGNYVLTKNVTMSREEAVGLLLSIGVEDVSRVPKTKTVTGKELFGALLPEDFDFISYHQDCEKCMKGGKDKCADDLCIFIKNGHLLSGVINKSYIGEGSGHILRTLYAQYGPEKAIKILGNISMLGIRYLLDTGFSTGVVDTDLSESVMEEIKKIIDDAEKKVTSLIEEYDAGKLEAFPSKTLKETLELKILEVLNKTRNKAGDVVLENSDEDNPTMIMANSGARGNPMNLAQIAALVGQQALRGERVNKGYANRTLSIFKQGDLTASPHGFIRNGYKHGLNPAEFFFHAMTGRDSLMDTALRTPKSGYLYRRLANALQDIKIEYDGTVRSSDQSIVQFSYGDDGLDISRTEGGSINVKRIVRNICDK